MAKKARRRKKSRRAEGTRRNTRPSIDKNREIASRSQNFLDRAYKSMWSAHEVIKPLEKYIAWLNKIFGHVRNLRDRSQTSEAIRTIKSWRNLHSEPRQVFFEIVITCSLPLPEITSRIQTYEEDDERAMRRDWESSAFDLYLTTFHMFKYWRRQNNIVLDDTTTLQFRVFHAQMQELYLKSRTSARLVGRVSRLEHL